jgi:hypothetical protein
MTSAPATWRSQSAARWSRHLPGELISWRGHSHERRRTPALGGILPLAARLRPTGIQCSICSGSAPAAIARSVVRLYRSASRSASPTPMLIPASSARRSVRPPASRRSSSTAAAHWSLPEASLTRCLATPVSWARRILSASVSATALRLEHVYESALAPEARLTELPEVVELLLPVAPVARTADDASASVHEAVTR